jgi:predicted flap endonuclease-1-like 5' DNA nuclease
MILAELNPFSKPVALSEILILLLTAAFIGWLIARLITNGRIRVLRESIDERKLALLECRSQQLEYNAVEPTIGKASKSVYPVIKSVEKTIAPAQFDDFQQIEGIGPKIEELLNREDISTFEQLSNTSYIRISHILKNAGPRFQMHDPTTWPEQARLAKEGKWEELQILKDKLISGKR